MKLHEKRQAVARALRRFDWARAADVTASLGLKRGNGSQIGAILQAFVAEGVAEYRVSDRSYRIAR